MKKTGAILANLEETVQYHISANTSKINKTVHCISNNKKKG